MGSIDWNPLHSPYFETIAATTQAITGIPVNSIATGIFGGPTAPAPTANYSPPMPAPYVPPPPPPNAADLSGESFSLATIPMWVWIVLGAVVLLLAFYFMRG